MGAWKNLIAMSADDSVARGAAMDSTVITVRELERLLQGVEDGCQVTDLAIGVLGKDRGKLVAEFFAQRYIGQRVVAALTEGSEAGTTVGDTSASAVTAVETATAGTDITLRDINVAVNALKALVAGLGDSSQPTLPKLLSLRGAVETEVERVIGSEKTQILANWVTGEYLEFRHLGVELFKTFVQGQGGATVPPAVTPTASPEPAVETKVVIKNHSDDVGATQLAKFEQKFGKHRRNKQKNLVD